MTEGNESYKKVMEILRSSRPNLVRPEEIENEVIKRIQKNNSTTGRFSDLIDSLFGWVYIGWVRRSFIAAAAIMVAVFIYQQALILKQVNNISKQPVVMTGEPVPGSVSEIGKKLTLYRISTKLSPANEINISEQELEQIIESYYALQTKYKDLLRIIEEDPELKKYIDGKLDENKKHKPEI